MYRPKWNVRLGVFLPRLCLAAVLVSLLLASGACGCDGTEPSSTTTESASSTTTTTAVAAEQFPDLSSDHVYYAEIVDLAARQIVGGFADGTIKPDAWITRQQFAKMIVLAAGYPVSESNVCTFGDVQKSGSDSLYPDNYVAVCAARGIAQGIDATHFAPTDYVTRAQLITMAARAADPPEPPIGYTPPFQDFSAAHYPWAKKAYYAGLLDGLEEFQPDHKGAYDFWANATRGEACVLLYALLHIDTAGSE